jgi:hypothetical protein
MSDVFISYSRKDKEFVQTLHKVLVEHKRDVWVDWEDIPTTADWRAEINAGIEAANSFIFVISPDSIASEICGEELASAIESKKRLIPLVRHDVDPKIVHPALASHNWLFSRHTDDFTTVVQKLVTALDTDLDWVKMHTRLLIRAREWDKKNRNRSFLLRGADLEEAEQWLATGADKNPSPTALHNAYIAASRKAATSLQRLQLGLATVAVIVSLVLAVLAFYQTQIAETRLIESENLRHAADADALTLGNAGNPELAVLLAVYASKNVYSPQADAALLRAVPLIYTRQLFLTNTSFIRAVAFSPDGKYVLTGAQDATIRLYDAQSGNEVRVYKGHVGSLYTIAFSPDSQYIASGGVDKIVRVWNTQTGAEIFQLKANTEAIRSVAFSPDGKSILVGTEDFILRLWDAKTGTQIQQFVGHTAAVRSGEFSLDGTRIVTGALDSTARIWDVATGKELLHVDTPDAVFTASFSPDGKEIVTGTDTSLTIWGAETGVRLRSLEGHKNTIWSVAFSPDGKYRVGQPRQDYTTVGCGNR